MGINGCVVWCQGNLSVKMATPAVALPRLHDPALSVVQHPPSGDCLTCFIANGKSHIYHANHARIINQILFGCFVCFAPLFSVATTLFGCFDCFALLFSVTSTTTTAAAAAAADFVVVVVFVVFTLMLICFFGIV